MLSAGLLAMDKGRIITKTESTHQIYFGFSCLYIFLKRMYVKVSDFRGLYKNYGLNQSVQLKNKN